MRSSQPPQDRSKRRVLSPSARPAKRSALTWMVPLLVCFGAATAMISLNLHFNRLVDERIEAGLLAASVGADLDEYRSTLIEGTDTGQAIGASTDGGGEDRPEPAGPEALNTAIGTLVAETAAPSRFSPDPSVWVDAASSSRPWSDLGAAEGLLTFRGNPTRTFYGRGPLPTDPTVKWSFDIGCSSSSVGGQPKTWCGSGWTGQPAVFRSPTTGAWWVAFGAYNRAVNFLDPADGSEAFPPYFTNDIIKGTVTVDPDGVPLLYTGSRDNDFYVVALDRDEPTALGAPSSDAVQPTLWNNDWDGSLYTPLFNFPLSSFLKKYLQNIAKDTSIG
ncbi:MAG: hypothetical protein GY773_31850, partial [Actinomycetia bacterium]|nr:hypothetical protein [Actinomycetes bacterium]